MSPRRTLFADDFRKQPRGPYLFDRWLAVPPLESPLGQFNIVLRQTPDADLVAAANALAGFLAENADAVLAAVHDSYLMCSYDEVWMEGRQIPTGLSAAGIWQYLDDPMIAVDRTRGGNISGVFYFSPQWDPEHGLYLKVLDGRVVRTEP